jgi:hypothetical protein
VYQALQARTWPLGHVVESQCVGRDLNPQWFGEPAGLQPAALPIMRPTQTSQRGRIRTFNPVRPKHVRCQIALHAEKHSRWESNPTFPG